MILGADGIGEQALNKIAELAVSSQLDEAERLDVQVKTDPGKLAQGEVESLVIAGEGLVMQADLRMQEMRIQMDGITVSPFKALFGNIKLTKPTTGRADIVLTEADINRAFNSDALGDDLRNLHVYVNGKPETLDIQHVDCHLLATGKVGLNAQVFLHQTGRTQHVSFTTTPRIREGDGGVVLDDVQYAEGKELSPELTNALVEKAKEILNLSNFEIEGIALVIRQLHVEAGRIALQAEANVTQLPST